MEAYSEGKIDAPHVFISYRRQDAAAVDDLVATLSATHPCWRDTAEIRGGQLWREAITRAIDQAYALILVVSATTEHSREVYAEYFYARGRQVRVIPLLVEDCELPNWLEGRNARAWDQRGEQALRQLKADLDSYRAESKSVVPASAVDTYLNSLRLGYLLNVGNYTPMLGEVRQRHRQVAPAEPLRLVDMQSRFLLRRSSPLLDDEAVREEVRDHQELLPSLHALRQVVLLGEPGIGKTTTLYKFADELRKSRLSAVEAPLPVILPLREWQGETDVETFIEGQLGGLADQCRTLIEAKRLYLLCDGLNEIARDARRADKVGALRNQIGTQLPMVVTCRELDYRDEVLRLEDMNTITMHPLEPERIQDFLTRYLIDSQGEEDGRAAAETLFWQIAGGDQVHALWIKWHSAGASLEQFFESEEVPRESPDVSSAMSWRERGLWHERVNTTANLIHLAANPYLLWMFLNIYLIMGSIPKNRGGLFDEFVFQLLKRERLTQGDSPNEAGERLSGSLEELAWKLQGKAAEAGEAGRGAELTLPRADAVTLLGGEQSLHRAASANLLEDAEPVRFTHQLLQEYFSARRLLTEIGKGLGPEAFWPPKRWWEPSGWEEAVVLAAGLSAEASSTVFHWVLPVNPEVAADCIRRSGMAFDDDTRLALRTHWLDALTDPEAQPERGRAAIGRVLSSVYLSSGEALDNRPGVGLRTDGVPDIDWVEIRGGQVVLEGNAGEQTVEDFAIARYPVTHVQFQAFIDAADGYRNPYWWEDMEVEEPLVNRRSEANAPRETVSWYQAVAFCRWLSERLGYTVRLPTEFEWQQAATGGDAQREYPWGEWEEGRCNSTESQLYPITAVGLYPHGTWPGGPLDMAGNVWEWCLNKYGDPQDGRIDRSRNYRVVRGGGFDDLSGRCRAAFRRSVSPGFPLPEVLFDNLGFRLLRPPSSDH